MSEITQKTAVTRTKIVTEVLKDHIFREEPKRFPGNSDWMIEKGAISISFIGDLNDSCWTSHVLVYTPNAEIDWLADENSFKMEKASGEGDKNTFHSQRKVLEARWFATSTDIIVSETQRILDHVSEVIRKYVSTMRWHLAMD